MLSDTDNRAFRDALRYGATGFRRGRNGGDAVGHILHIADNGIVLKRVFLYIFDVFCKRQRDNAQSSHTAGYGIYEQAPRVLCQRTSYIYCRRSSCDRDNRDCGGAGRFCTRRGVLYPYTSCGAFAPAFADAAFVDSVVSDCRHNTKAQQKTYSRRDRAGCIHDSFRCGGILSVVFLVLFRRKRSDAERVADIRAYGKSQRLHDDACKSDVRAERSGQFLCISRFYGSVRRCFVRTFGTVLQKGFAERRRRLGIF